MTMMRSRVAATAAVLISSVLLMVGCGSSNDDAAPSSTTLAPIAFKGEVTSAGISQERCDANKAAGAITYMSPYDYAASAGIIDVVTAAEQGYFKKMCLDVKIMPSNTGESPAAVAANRAQFASLGSMSEVAAADSGDAGLVAVLQYGHTSIEELVVHADSDIQALPDLQSKTIGTKGAGIPYSVQAMLAKAGVDVKTLKTVSVGYALSEFEGKQTDAEPVYKSNEPRRLQEANVAVRTFDPASNDVAASFGVLVTSQSFKKAHPEAVDDFARAALKGFDYASQHPVDAVAASVAKSDPSFYLTTDSEEFRWTTERNLVASSTPEGSPIGIIVDTQVQDELTELTDLDIVDNVPPISDMIDDTVVPRLVDRAKSNAVIWPDN